MNDSRPWRRAQKNSRGSSENLKENYRINQIDIIKGLAVISVILIHTFNTYALSVIGAPYHIWQAVPVFILLAGFTGAYAYNRLGETSLVRLYDIRVVSRRFVRILLPFVVIWAFQLTAVLFLLKDTVRDFSSYPVAVPDNGADLILTFLQGAYGPGSYFIPVILQQIIVLPVFYYVAVRSPDRMIALVFIIDLVLEYAAIVLGVSPTIYSILYIRYMVAGALGVWLATRIKKPYPWLVFGALFSLWYITAVFYFDFQFWFIYPAWSFFSPFSYFWTLALVITLLFLLPAEPVSRLMKLLKEIGKASWHIFLIQMTYFFLWPTFGDSITILLSLIGDGGLRFTCQLISYACINLAVCLPAGYGFYLVNERVNMTLKKPDLIIRL